MRRLALRKLRTYSWEQRLLLLEACLWLGMARALLLTMPFQQSGRLLRLDRCDPLALQAASDLQLPRAASVGWAVEVAAQHTPWQSLCLAQGLAAAAMLKRRRIAGVLVLGVRHDGASALLAHAWVRCGSLTLTGKTSQPFTPIAAFTWAPALQPQSDAAVSRR
jgi:hypothetical protein